MRRDTFLPLFLRTAALFLVFWLLTMGLLSLYNLDAQRTAFTQDAEEGLDSALRNVQLVLEGTAEEWEKPALMEYWIGSCYYHKGAMAVYQLEDSDGNELVRSPLFHGSFTLPGTGTYDHFLHFEAVLTDEEILSLARGLREERSLLRFYGTESGLYDEYLGADQGENFTVGLRGEVTGVVEGNVVYPQKLVYWYEDGPVTLLDADSAFFDGKELSTITFDAAQLSSPLIWSEDTPETALTLFRQAEGRLDDLRDGGTTPYQGGGEGYARSSSVPFSQDLSAAIGVSYRPWTLAFQGLGMVYMGTLLLALLLAYATARAQANSLRRERLLTSAVAHELKTPLALLRSYAEGLREDIAPEKREEYLETIMDESDRVAALVDDLLELSRLSSRKAPFQPEPVDLTALTEEVLRALERPAAAKKVVLEADLSPCVLSGDSRRLRGLLSNLTSNALRHCPAGGEVSVSLAVHGHTARLQVDNDGEPIPPEALPHLWDPFYRVDSARSRDSGGSGLGLAIVRETTRLHGGRCGVKDMPWGVRFWVELPVCKAGTPMV